MCWPPRRCSSSRPKNMRVAVEGTLPLGVTAKDMILAIIGKIGTAGGTGYVIEYAGAAIRALSMEGRMTVCNMTIEARRAGRPDRAGRDDLRLSQGPAAGAQGRGLGAGGRLLADAAVRRRRRLRQRGHAATPATSRRRSPGAPARRTSSPITGAVPDPAERRRRRPARRRWSARCEYMGLTAGQPMTGRHGRRGLHRLLHQQPDRGPARRRRRSSRGRKVAAGVRAMVVPGSGLVKRAGRGRGARPDLPRRRLRVARAGLLDVPGHEPRQAAAGRALRLDLNRNFEGRQGPGGRTHLMSPAWPPPPPSPATSPTCAS